MAAPLQTAAPTTTGSRAGWHAMPALEATRALRVDRTTGLTSPDAAIRLAEFGPNRLPTPAGSSRWQAVARACGTRLQLVLLAASAVAFALGESATGLAVLAVTPLNAILALRQERRDGAGVTALQRTLPTGALVLRDGELRNVDAEALVPGDIVRIGAGDVVPADGRLLESASLEVEEGTLTGGSAPADKVLDAVGDDGDAPLGDRTDMVYAATWVTRGTAEVVVTATGAATEAGQVAELLRSAEPPDMPRRRLAALTRPIVWIAGAALAAAAALNLSRGAPADTVLEAAVALAIGATPTALPAAVAAILSRGTAGLAERGVTVTWPRAVEAAGTTSAINLATASTLTRQEPTAVEMVLAGRRHAVSGAGFDGGGAVRRAAGVPAAAALEPLAVPMALTTDAVVAGRESIGDPAEAALVVLARKAGLDVDASRAAFPRIAAVPYDASYELTATFHRLADAGVVRCFVRGMPEQLLGRGVMILGPDMRTLRVDDDVRAGWLAEADRLAGRGLRVIALARRDIDATRFDPGAELLPLVDGLTLLGLVGIADPLRPGVRAAVAAAKAAGIRVRLVSGDHPLLAAALGRRAGIGRRVATGAELARTTTDEAARVLDRVDVVAQAGARDRARLVDVLQRAGEVVAVAGDGLDDVPALAAAHVGIAVGGAASDVSRAAASMIAPGGDVSAAVRIVEAGRATYRGLLVAVRYQLAPLVGTMAAFVGAAALGVAEGLPLLPLQVLYVSLTVLLVQAVALGSARPPDRLMAQPPRPARAPIADRREAAWSATAGVVIAAATVGAAAVVEHDEGIAAARTAGLVAFALAALLYSFTCRSATRSAFSRDTFADRGFLVASGVSLAAVVLAAATLHQILSTTALGLGQCGLCAGAALAVVAASEIRKALLRRSTTTDPNGGSPW